MRMIMMMIYIIILLLRNDTSTTSWNVVVSAQATGFCHRPNIKPNFVHLDSDVAVMSSNSNSNSNRNDNRNPMNNNNNDIFLIAHRGASYHIPIEHSLPSYRLALELNSHYIESDVAISQDGILFPMHSMDLTMTTNILTSSFVTVQQRPPWLSIYANRSSYWSFNFTFAELQTLTLQQRKSTTVTTESSTSSSSFSSPSSSSSSSSSSLNHEPSPPPPSERTNLYDHLFTIPSLEDVVHLLVDWNINEIPKLHSNRSTTTETVEYIEPTDPTAASHLPNYYYDRYKAGLYLEFKNTDWIYAETGYNMVELLFAQITQSLLLLPPPPSSSSPPNRKIADDTTTSTQRYTWKDLFTCYERIRFDEYIIPPLILQSFNHSDLLLFHTLWHQYQIPHFADPSTTTNQLSTVGPEPLYVVLVDAPKCYDDSFWYIISNDQYRSFINGIGCHKNCLLPFTPTSSSNNGSFGNDNSDNNNNHTSLTDQEMVEEHYEHIDAIMQRITELQMVLHVWTERPEQVYLNHHPLFRTVMDEIYYLKCNVSHVHGIFTESVDMALRALHIPCPTSTTSSTTSGSPQQTAICNNNTGETNHMSISVVFLSFLCGIIVTILMNRFCHLYRCTRWGSHKTGAITNHTTNHSNSYQHATAVSNDDDDDDDNQYDKNGFNDNQKNHGLELSVT